MRIIARINRVACKGQVLAEYGVVLALVALVLTGMTIYIQRGLQGRYKDATDFVRDYVQDEIEARGIQTILPPAQYEPYYQDSQMIAQMNSQLITTYNNGVSTKDIVRDVTSILPNADPTRPNRQELPQSDATGD
ncbi:MAG: hypothetical protein JW714_01085 [Candidatus Omnitrophica bacterium]|nr:hypothetical protein [Candidatus Omnitrophota bacterium]